MTVQSIALMTGKPSIVKKKHDHTDLTMQSRATRAITKAIVAAGTAGAMATACWLLNRILDGNNHKCIEELPSYIENEDSDSDGEYDGDFGDPDDSFTQLPVVSESDDEVAEDAMGYTSEYFTPHYDVYMLSVSIQTFVDPLSDVPSSECRLCRAAEAFEDHDAAGDGFALGDKHRTLSFTDTECSSRSVASIASEFNDFDEEDVVRTTEQWFYVRL
ncbi:hypothetical protein PInf_017272 [Phytophthora infestans]|nr:hypothetical protein PInf_017228 [Phytophthora infestans]KAI9991892.1 hypothetical protein PInf_017272 [Phytophthora infestans]